MKIVSFALAITALVLFGVGAKAESADNNVCLDADHIDHTVVVDDRTVLYYMRGHAVWKNTLRGACPGLKFEQGFSEVIRGGLVCSNTQMIRVMRSGALCSLGAFTPYVPVKSTAH